MPQLLEISGLGGPSRKKRRVTRKGLGVTAFQTAFKTIPGAGGSAFKPVSTFAGLGRNPGVKKLLGEATRYWNRGRYMAAYTRANAAYGRARGQDRENARILMNRCIMGGMKGLI